MTKVTTWLHDQQLEMLQLIKLKWPPCQGPKNIEEELRSRIKK